MSKRKRISKVDKWIKEGRGTGSGMDYQPWLKIQDVSLLGRSTRLKGIKTGRFQIDVTIADIYLVNSLDVNKVIGRPVIYAGLDVYSRIITGLYVGLEGPSWIGAIWQYGRR